MGRIEADSKPPSRTAGRFFLSIFALIFLTFGAVFGWLALKQIAQTVRIWSWKTVECNITESSVRESTTQDADNRKFQFEVAYSYVFDGAEFTSSRYRFNPNSGAFADYTDAARLTVAYPPGGHSVCYVNPNDPHEAILKRNSLWSLAAILFPMVFVACAVGGIWFLLRPRSVGTSASAISDRAKPDNSRRIGAFAFGLFFVVGCALVIPFFVLPAFKIFQARHWPAVPCSVVFSNVRSHHSDDGTTYSVDILYEYVYRGEEHKSNRYRFFNFSSSGYASKRAIVDQHPPGTQMLCYVNPDDPTEAVLERGYSAGLLIGLVPLLFVVVGGTGLLRMLRAKPEMIAGLPATPSVPSYASATSSLHSAATTSSWSTAPSTRISSSGQLKASLGPVRKFVAAVVIALFWNGIVSVFLVNILKETHRGFFELFGIIFMIPFVVVGLGILGAVVYFFLGLFNPRASLITGSDAIPLGGQIRVEWQFSGRVHVLQRVRIWIEGREEATYRRGTSTSTDKSVFARVEVKDSSQFEEICAGSATVTIPAHLMHSFTAQHNKIVWNIRLKGQIAIWPDVNEEYPIVILPAKRN